METLLERQDRLHSEATRLLETVLLPLLSKYGTAIVGGSYLYRLMYQPDIDIDVVSAELSKEDFAHLCAEILLVDGVMKLRTSDKVSFQQADTSRPTGYWVCPTIQYEDTEWTIDIWLQRPEWHTGDTTRFKDAFQNTPDEMRNTILTLKAALIDADMYRVRKEFQSVDVYASVLGHDVHTVGELRAWKNGSR